MTRLVITIPGLVVGKGRARSRIAQGKSGKQFVSHYTPESTVRYENLVRFYGEQAMRQAGQHGPWEGHVALGFEAMWLPPASWSQKKRVAAASGAAYNGTGVLRPAKKPDIDNVLKSVLDGLNGIVFVDDVQVVDLLPCRKSYSTRDELIITVETRE